jgi:hypothetical protein
MDPGQEKIDAANRGAALWGNFVISMANYPPRMIVTDKDTGNHRPRSTSPTRRDWVGWIDTSGSECGGAENGSPDHQRVEHEAEREIKDDADDYGRDVILQSALGNRRPPGSLRCLRVMRS